MKFVHILAIGVQTTNYNVDERVNYFELFVHQMNLSIILSYLTISNYDVDELVNYAELFPLQ